jgi:flagellar hook-associated protein FlgK
LNYLELANELNSKLNNISAKNSQLIEIDKKLSREISEINELLESGLKELNILVRASELITNLSTAVTQDTLDKISLVVNKALGVIFKRKCKLLKKHKVYPQFRYLNLVTQL